jgi:hypothetical protein
MFQLVNLPKGNLQIEVIDKFTGLVIQSSGGDNSLTLEAVKLLLGQLIGPSLITANTNAVFPDATGITGRPSPTFIASGPKAANSISFIKIGFVESTETPTSVASNTDTDLESDTTLFIPLTEVTFLPGAVKFILEYEVTGGLIGKKLYEAGLFTLGNNTYNSGSNLITTNSTTGCVMFSRKVHVPIIANSNTTLRYTWTISMSNQE